MEGRCVEGEEKSREVEESEERRKGTVWRGKKVQEGGEDVKRPRNDNGREVSGGGRDLEVGR